MCFLCSFGEKRTQRVQIIPLWGDSEEATPAEGDLISPISSDSSISHDFERGMVQNFLACTVASETQDTDVRFAIVKDFFRWTLKPNELADLYRSLRLMFRCFASPCNFR
jgi:hypothetical protein